MNRRLVRWSLTAANVALLLVLAWLASTPLVADAPPPAAAPSASIAPLAPPAKPAAPTAPALAAVWQQPLFSPERRPDAPAATPVAAPVLDGVTLTGVLISRDGQWALLTLPGHGPRKLKLGAALDDGWTLSALSVRSATFSRQGTARTLSIPVLRLPVSTRTPPLTLPDTQAP